jgi:hypothetical protein
MLEAIIDDFSANTCEQILTGRLSHKRSMMDEGVLTYP